MGLTVNSTGFKSFDTGLDIKKSDSNDRIIALAGNPNVGKSTVFNALTGMRQHTGNWPGKTVTNASGVCDYKNERYVMVDLPGTYSLMAHSAEEEVARDFICFGNHDAVVVVCDATCLERNLNLVLQTIEITKNVVVCVNLMDEAKKKGINVNLKALSKKLGVPVVGTNALKKRGLDRILDSVGKAGSNKPYCIRYTKPVEEAIAALIEKIPDCNINKRWIALRLIEGDKKLTASLYEYLGIDELPTDDVLQKSGITLQTLKDNVVSCIILSAEEICNDVVTYESSNYNERDRRLDRILTNRYIGYPIMLLLLGVVFWLTIVGANYPSALISNALFGAEKYLVSFFMWLKVPQFIYEMLVFGVYRVVAWVVSVMLPPMAIFFPLFTLLEDLGYLPRIAFNLDNVLKKCNACGKQALTMCMGFGCNAAGIVGCRIIDSPRERLIAMLTNSFVPCNGRFPTIIAIISMFLVYGGNSLLSALLLTLVVVLGIFITFIVSYILSKTILKGQPSSFVLELPPYRRPRIGRVIVSSVIDRTVFVLGRAVAVAAPAGLIIWLFANVNIGDVTLLNYCSSILDPFARLIGLDGVILLAFILGLPANEIVVPIIIMAYMSAGSLVQYESLSSLKTLLVDNGWTWVTAVCTMLFSLFHWPCSTTLITIKKETGSFKWMLVSLALPTAVGMIICFCIATLARL